MRSFFGVALLILSNLTISISAGQDSFKLELLQVLFRHGDRAAEENEVYPMDPYNETFKELGYGQLTITGKRREYKIGQILRERYDDFLGDYDPDEVYAYSTNYDRTKASLDLVLAGLYPPTSRTAWSEKILWSPIPTNYNRSGSDIFQSFYDCDRYKELMRNAERSATIQSYMTENRLFLDYAENSTGIEGLTHPRVLYGLYCNLRAVVSLGLPLPFWCSWEDYARIVQLARLYYFSMTSTQELRRLTAGQNVKRLLSNVKENDAKRIKIYLYSAHDNNVAVFNIAHGFANVPIIPDYGSVVVVEKLRDTDDRVYLRMFMWTGAEEQWIPLKMPNCDAACPLEEYTEAMKWVLPDAESEKCYSTRC